MPRDFSHAATDLFGPLKPEPGDAVIHVEYGIGRFEGIEKIEVADEKHEVARLTYADGESVMLPLREMGSVWRYGRGPGIGIDRLKGSTWQARRDAIRAEIDAMAQTVIERATARHALASDPLETDADRYAAICDGFGHDPTDDQRAAFAAIEADLASDTPMDRIVLGDVGFGKTEVFLRAAAFAALAGKQVAVAAPTTVLCRQHAATLRARLDGSGLTVREYSSNVPEAERKETRAGLAEGRVDIVIGTHGLTAKSVVFDRLGLIVIDEEHKFGTRRKETLYRMCEGHNRLVTTATPIPKVLTAAELGMIDLSILSEAPGNRKPVETAVEAFDPEAVADALRAEAERCGQSYVICPRIAGIDAILAMLAETCPDLTVAVAHGGLKNAEVGDAMHAFGEGEADILVATALVENGLDVPNANTMVVFDADRFGLGQLHQLRGRVGRSDRQARMLVLAPEKRRLRKDARERLGRFAEMAQLGAGFDISLADRNERGAGDILGTDQSGHLSAIGAGYYRHLVHDALMKHREAG